MSPSAAPSAPASSFADPTVPVPAIDETIPVTGGTVWIARAPGHDALRCPLVVVEGFPGGHGFEFSARVLAQHGVLERLQGAGHDLVVVGLDDGLRSILDNAGVLKEALALVAARTPLPITVLGWSMGGLVARVALSELEADGVEHRVVTLVTWDTPHRGTVTQLGVQWLVAHLGSALPALGASARLLSSVANQEMDMVWLDGAGVPGLSPHRAALLERLRWPAAPRRVLIACGRGDGVETLPAGATLLHWQGDRGEIVLRTAGSERPIASGRFDGRDLPPLPGDTLGPLDGAPGGREDYVAQAAAVLAALDGAPAGAPRPPMTCTVPTSSALDLDAAAEGGGAGGDATNGGRSAPVRIACELDQPHLAITATVAPAILRAIGPPFDPDRFDPRDAGFLADPFPVYASFRRWAPLHHVAVYNSLWCFRAAECTQILTDSESWLKHPPGQAPPRPGPLAAMDAFPPGLFSADPPSHTAIRTAVEPAVVAAAERAPEITRAHAAALLAGLAGRGRIELMRDYALPLPAAVLMDLLGLEDDPIMRQALMAWQSQITAAHDASQPPALLFAGMSAAMALRTFFTGIVRRHRADPRPGLLGELCDRFAAAELADELLYATLCDLLVAGYLSTTFLIATGAWRLLSSGDAAARVRAERSLVPALVDELLRLDGPVQVIDRYAATPQELDGVELPAGTRVTAVVGAADRDPAVVQAPDELRLDRERRIFAFGRGIHTCVGAPLVEQVAPVALGALLDLPVLELDGDPQWQADPYLRAATSVPVRISA